MIRIPKSDLIVKISFTIFIFFSFFPKDIPFQATLQEQGVEEIESSNITNQIINVSIFILSFIAAIPKFKEILDFIKREKFLALFLLWALISVTWSDFPIVSLKRWFQIFTYYLTMVVFLTYFPNQKEIIRILKPIVYLYIILTLVSVLVIPGAKDPTFGTWRGLAQTKNTLGQAGIICSVLTLIFYLNQPVKFKKYIAFMFFLLALIISLGTVSSTAYTALFIFVTLSIFFYLKVTIFNKIAAGYFLFFASIFFIAMTILTTFIYNPETLDYIQGLFGKAGSIQSDRSILWQVILLEIGNHPLQGCGFQSFWVVESTRIQLLYNTFVWLPIQAHNGYLDLTNELGLVGLVLFLSIIFNFFQNSIRNKNLDLWAWFVVLPLVINITESNILRVGPISPVYFMLGYLTSFSQVTKPFQ